MVKTEGEPPESETAPDTDGRGLSTDMEFAARIARRYYFDDQSKVAIARECGLSRFQVARLLQEARRHGIVRIEIGVPGRLDRELAMALQELLGIPRAVVVEVPTGSPSTSLHHLGGALAAQVAETVREGDAVGLMWSRAIDSMAGQLEQLDPCTVIQLSGHLHVPGATSGTVELVRRMADISGGLAHPIYAPLVVQDPATARALRSQPEIAHTLAMADDLDTAIVSVGAWRPSASAVFDVLSAQAQQEAASLGAVGEIGGHLFDTDGKPVICGLSERIVSVSLEQLRGSRHVVLSSFGAYRAEATIAATRTGLVTTLVTDDALARTLLDRYSDNQQPADAGRPGRGGKRM